MMSGTAKKKNTISNKTDKAYATRVSREWRQKGLNMQEVAVTLEELRGILSELPDGEMLTVTPEAEGVAPEGSVDEPCRAN